MTLTATYEEFLARKAREHPTCGRHVDPDEISPVLFPFQRDLTAWALRTGRAGCFADTGLGKTLIQIEWARLSASTSLIVAPLSVARQTTREAAKLGVEVRYVRSGDAVTGPGVWITNYEMVDRFNPARFGAVVLDESSLLANVEGKTRRLLTEQFARIPYRLACTATPIPNDVAEITNHAEFLGVMRRVEMLAHFFVHDDAGWRPKGHAVFPMFDWMATWAMALRRPSDFGYDDDGFVLPPLRIIGETVDAHVSADGQLFAVGLGGVTGRSRVRRETLPARVARAVELASQPGQWIVWCGLNAEADTVAHAVPGAVNVEGSQSPDAKARAFEAFQDGDIRVLVTKSSIAGFGMNFQNCHRMVFVGLSDSWQSYYQCIRRCWRYGQGRPVDAHVVVSPLEQEIVQNVRRKEIEADRLIGSLVERMARSRQ